MLQTSKHLRGEMLAGTVDSIRKVRIDGQAVTTNFIARQGILAPDEIGLCKLLEITIVRPSPRSAVGFAKLRSNVHAFVDILNKSGCKMLPRLAARLDSGKNTTSCEYNDFALLMGPFSKLTKPCRAVMMYRSGGFFGFSPTIERLCDLLEAAISGTRHAESARNILAYQQFMLDIKIPFTLLACLTDNEITTAENKELYMKSATRVIEACLGLKGWYGANNKNPPTWLETLCDGESGSVPTWLAAFQNRLGSIGLNYDHATLWEMLGEQNKGVLKAWLSGHYKRRNPFWDEMKMD